MAKEISSRSCRNFSMEQLTSRWIQISLASLAMHTIVFSWLSQLPFVSSNPRYTCQAFFSLHLLTVFFPPHTHYNFIWFHFLATILIFFSSPLSFVDTSCFFWHLLQLPSAFFLLIISLLLLFQQLIPIILTHVVFYSCFPTLLVAVLCACFAIFDF